MAKRISNETYDSISVQDREMEDANFSQPYADKEVRRTNPKRHDYREDWVAENNEKGNDSDVSNRYSSMPISVLLATIDNLCSNPSAKELQAFQSFIHTASNDVRSVVMAYIQEQIDLLDWNRTHLRATASYTNDMVVDAAIRHYVLSHIFG